MGYHNIIRPAMSCAIREVENIDEASTPEKFIRDVYEKTLNMNFGHKFRFVMFSHYRSYFNVCDRICAYIEGNNLGTITKTEPALNPNSMNEVIIYTWKIDNWEKYDAWYQEQTKPKPDRWITKVSVA